MPMKSLENLENQPMTNYSYVNITFKIWIQWFPLPTAFLFVITQKKQLPHTKHNSCVVMVKTLATQKDMNILFTCICHMSTYI